VQAGDLESQIAQFLREITIPERFHDWAIAQIDRLKNDEETTSVAKRESLAQAKTAATKALDNLTKLRIRDLISDAEFLKERQEIEREQIRIERELSTGEADMFEPLKEFISFSTRASDWFAKGDLQTKRLILMIVGSNPSLRDKKLSMDARKPFIRWDHEPTFSNLSRFMKDIRNLNDQTELRKMASLIAEVRRRSIPTQSVGNSY